MNKFDFTDEDNLRSLAQAAARAVNYAREEMYDALNEDNNTASYKAYKTREYKAAMVLHYTMQTEAQLANFKARKKAATDKVATARAYEYKAAADTYSALADDAREEYNEAYEAWMDA